MSELKATPGPWYRDEYGNLKSPESSHTLSMIPFSGVMITSGAEANANTCLIAAAPDLYEALEALLETCHAEPHGESERRAAIAALAKARGES
jgi:hypothetical protein